MINILMNQKPGPVSIFAVIIRISFHVLLSGRRSFDASEVKIELRSTKMFTDKMAVMIVRQHTPCKKMLVQHLAK